MRILVVEDDSNIGDGVQQGLCLDDYASDWVVDKKSAFTALAANRYELMILDLGLPDGSGLELLKHLRRRKDDMPVIILTAYDTVQDKINGLDCGADDYIVKPFDLDELRARVRALRRRSHGRANPLLSIGDVVLDPSTKIVTLKGEEVNIGPREFAILHTLMESPGRILSKSQIEDSLYGWNMEVESNTVEVHIHGIRRKLGRDLIRTVRHLGYKIEALPT